MDVPSKTLSAPTIRNVCDRPPTLCDSFFIPWKPFLLKSNLIHEDVVYFIAGEAKIAHGGRRTRVVEPFGQDLETHPELGALHESESLPQSVRPVVSMIEMYHLGPFFHHGVNGLNG